MQPEHIPFTDTPACSLEIEWSPFNTEPLQNANRQSEYYDFKGLLAGQQTSVQVCLTMHLEDS